MRPRFLGDCEQVVAWSVVPIDRGAGCGLQVGEGCGAGVGEAEVLGDGEVVEACRVVPVAGSAKDVGDAGAEGGAGRVEVGWPPVGKDRRVGGVDTGGHVGEATPTAYHRLVGQTYKPCACRWRRRSAPCC